MPHRTWLEISKDALLHNLKEFLNLLKPETRFMAVVKANAYGHGLAQVASLLANYPSPTPSPSGRGQGEGTLWFGVDSLDEALMLRTAGITQPILTLGYVPLDRLQEAVEQGIRLTVYNRETIEVLGKIPNLKSEILHPTPYTLHPIRLHLKLETGTNRQGVLPSEALEFCQLIQKYPHLKLEGISSHFANIEDTTDHTFALLQLKRFNEALNFIFPPNDPNDRNNPNHLNPPSPLIRHMACSAATILFSQTYFDMVRVGIGLYGLWPSRETFVSAKASSPQHSPLRGEGDINRSLSLTGRGQGEGSLRPHLLPVLSWKTRIAQIKKVRAGESVGYGLSEQVNADTSLAVLPVGYSDGYDRKLSLIGNVLIHGKRRKILGRISMNMCMADITHVPEARLEDEVVLIGEQSPRGVSLRQQGDSSSGVPDRITADELAQKIGTINYEVVARINPLLPRIVL